MRRLVILVVVVGCGGGTSRPAEPGGSNPIARCEGGDGEACGQLGNQHRLYDLAYSQNLGQACFARAFHHNRYIKSCDSSQTETAPECPPAQMFAEGKRAVELLTKGCSLKHEESCKVVELYEQGLARDWLLPGPDDTEAIYHP